MTQLIINIEDGNMVPNIKRILGALKGVTIAATTPENAEKQAFDRAESLKKLCEEIRKEIPNGGIDDDIIIQECKNVRQELYEKRIANGEK